MLRQTIILILTFALLTSCRSAPFGTTPETATDVPAGSTPKPARSTPPAFTQTPKAKSGEPVLNVPYSDAPTDDPRLLTLDIYPTDQADCPVMIYVHGGGWYRGVKVKVEEKPAAFNANGFVFVAINYRLYPEADASEQMHDLAASIAWVKNNIAQYGGDPERIFLLGHSAGAHLVSLAATDKSYLETEGLSLTDIKGVISFDTQAYDLYTLLTYLPESNGLVYRSVFGDDPANWKKFSPITYAAEGRGIPPFFLVYTGEKPNNHELTERFADALESAGVPVIVRPATDQTHGQLNSQFGEAGDPVSMAVFVWLEELLKRL